MQFAHEKKSYKFVTVRKTNQLIWEAATGGVL